jgi:endonuclease YncB( thermonuclease family)
MGTDRYGRTLATVSGPAGDLSCGQLKAGLAIYKPRWDNQHRVASLCPEQAQDTL